MASKEYTVYFPVYAEVSVQVTVDLDELEDQEDAVDVAIDQAYDNLPRGICAQCSGWGKKHSIELDPSVAEAQYAEDEDGQTVWGDPDKKLGW